MEVNVDANTVGGGTNGVEEREGDITGALMVTTPTLNKGATMVDKGATTGPAKASGALTSTVARVTS